eukprot:Tbor_TRINITY_DN5847_c0_g1::TRINITY_DN5847_c0_g1_i2::g.6141::m.6141
MHIRFFFVYSHSGQYHNEYVDRLAANYHVRDNHEPAPLTMKDSEAAIKRRVIAEWKNISSMSDNSPRARLLSMATGDLPKAQKLLPTCQITGKALTRDQQVQLARIRSSHSEMFGYFHAQLVSRPNACRFCTSVTRPPNITPVKQTKKHKSTAVRFNCQYCEFFGRSAAELHEHQAFYHPTEKKFDARIKCEFCGGEWPTTR